MNVDNKARQLILLNSKIWLAGKLGITRVTLDNRLVNYNWKKLEIEKLISL